MFIGAISGLRQSKKTRELAKTIADPFRSVAEKEQRIPLAGSLVFRGRGAFFTAPDAHKAAVAPGARRERARAARPQGRVRKAPRTGGRRSATAQDSLSLSLSSSLSRALELCPGWHLQRPRGRREQGRGLAVGQPAWRIWRAACLSLSAPCLRTLRAAASSPVSRATPLPVRPAAEFTRRASRADPSAYFQHPTPHSCGSKAARSISRTASPYHLNRHLPATIEHPSGRNVLSNSKLRLPPEMLRDHSGHPHPHLRRCVESESSDDVVNHHTSKLDKFYQNLTKWGFPKYSSPLREPPAPVFHRAERERERAYISHICICIYIYIYVYMYHTYIHIYIYIYTYVDRNASRCSGWTDACGGTVNGDECSKPVSRFLANV